MALMHVGLLIGLAAGLLGGLVGVGGGVIMVPLLTGWAKLGQHRAHATSLLAVVATGAFGALAYIQGGAVAWGATLILVVASTLSSALAARFSARVSPSTLRRMFGYLMLVAAFLLLFEHTLPNISAGDGFWPHSLLLLFIGTLAGSLAGLLGIGGGSIVVPLLVLALGFDQQLAQGTSLAAMIPAALSGSLVHWRSGNIVKQLALPLLFGVALGAWLGGVFALSLPDVALKIIFAVLMVWMGTRYIRRAAIKREQDKHISGKSVRGS